MRVYEATITYTCVRQKVDAHLRNAGKVFALMQDIGKATPTRKASGCSA